MKNIFKALLLLTALLAASGVSSAKTISEIFGEGVFHTKWGMLIDEVKAIHPNGETKDVYGSTRYFIKDGRALFGIDREKDSFIEFVFGSDGKLIGISIGMPPGTGGFAKAQSNITSAIGVESELVPNSAGITMIKWSDGTGVELSLFSTPSAFSPDITLAIESKPTPTDTTKEALGF